MWFKRSKVDVEKMVAGVSALVSLPQVYFRISEVLNDPRSTAAKIGDAISHDPALTARLLRFANSPVYALRQPVDSVPRAVMLLGLQELRMLALVSSMGAAAFSKPPSDLLDMSAYWHHSVFTALVAKQLAKRSGVKHLDRLFVAGLLHDVGQLVLAHHAPDSLRKVVAQLDQYPHQRVQIERKVLGCDHAEVGAALLRHWQLPEALWAPVLCHHEPERAPAEYAMDTALIHIANAIADGVEPCRRGSVPAQTSPISARAWELCGLNREVIEPVTSEANLELFDMLTTVCPGGGLVL